MENASKALIIAASVLITVMIFSFMMYMFSRASSLSGRLQDSMGTEKIAAFNAQFNNYATKEKVEIQNASGTKTQFELKNSFGSDSNENIGLELRKVATSNYNEISDVLTAVNLAYDINYDNNDGYKYGKFEKINTVEIVVDLSNVSGDFTSIRKYYLLEPCKSVNPNCIYGTTSSIDTTSSTEKKLERISLFTNEQNGIGLNSPYDSGELNLYDLIKEMNERKIITLENKDYTIYKYYFFGEYNINSETGKIDTLTFTAVKDKGYDLYEY